MKKYVGAFLLVFIFMVGVFIYFYKLDRVPNGFYIDEALPGYNAYSIFKTGKDEYGKFMPIVFRFYGSFNPSLYTYLTVIPVGLLGLNTFAVRFGSSLAGLILILPFFIFLKHSSILKNSFSKYIGTFLLMASPWLILYSRVGYEVSLGLLLYSVGIVFFYLGVKKDKFLIPGIIFLSLSTYAAYTERFLVPIFLCLYYFLFKKIPLKVLVLGFLTQIPNLYLIITGAFFPKEDLFWSGNILKEFFARYITYFNPRSLFFLPDPDKQRSIPELSTFYFWMVIPYFVGLFYLVKEKKSMFIRFLVLLLLISPIPATLTKDPFSTHRAIPLVFPLMAVMTLGIDRIISKLKAEYWVPIISLLIALSGLLLWRSYFVLLPGERASVWSYGFDKLAEIIKNNPDTKFVIDQARIKPAYIYFAFFLKYDPLKFQQETDKGVKTHYYKVSPFDSYYKFGNVEIRNVNWKIDPCTDAVLIGDELTFSQNQVKEHFLEKVLEIRDPVDYMVFQGYKTNPSKKCKI